MSDTTTETPHVKELHRSREDRMIAGVCGGLGRYFDLNPVFFRVGFVVLALLGGSGIIVYGAAALVIPDEGRRDSIAVEALRNRRAHPWPLVGLGLVAIASIVLLSHASLWPESDFLWIVVLLAGGALLWVHTRDLSPPPDDPAVPAPVLRRRRRILRAAAATVAALFVAASVVVAYSFAALDLSLGDGIGERSYHVGSAANLRDRYELGIGELDLDLSNLTLPKGETRVDAHVGIGELRIVAPPDVAVRYDTEANYGDVVAFGEEAHGHKNGLEGENGTGDRVLVVHASVGAGEVDLDRAVR
ncbi:MAG TPA: PspC domain-containing protein [Gaiellaceae bacterium]|jgi:phage shock protein PspC (stress-responsive transcriptional regulator)